MGVVTVDEPLQEERLWMGMYKLDDISDVVEYDESEGGEEARDEDDIWKGIVI